LRDENTFSGFTTASGIMIREIPLRDENGVKVFKKLSAQECFSV